MKNLLCAVAVFLGAWGVLWGGGSGVWPELSPATVSAQEVDSPPDKATPEAGAGPRDEVAVVENPFPNRPLVPEGILDGGVAWLNTSGPISMKDLRGKIVLFDFWTYCCINCMHVLPDLKFLEQKYPDQIVVIGVHSAKFDNEKESENIRQAILRYEIEHPVVNDANMLIWRKFGARAWPTLALVDPEGRYCGSISGEGHRELLDNIITQLITYHRKERTLDETPIRFDLERHSQPATPLRYPGKVLADEKNDRLFISDSNHNRIVVASLAGKLLDVIGNGSIGARDGSYETAQFDHPQGMELVGETLYVADTENHLIRTVDLRRKIVSTLAGTGEQARHRLPGGAVRELALNSPWAVFHHEGTLYIAMAGPHQIWSHRLGTDQIGVYAGSGREDIINGPKQDAAFAQPSGLASDGKNLFVADSEGSAIRNVRLSDGQVSTIVGTSELPRGRSLFEFGDVDGVGGKARLQHPLGVAYHNGTLYVADAYNHKVKTVDLKTQAAETWLGDGTAGDRLQPLRLSEPAGLSIAAGKLFIADTNNHRIVAADLETGAAVEFIVEGLQPPKPPKAESDDLAAGVEFTAIAPQTISAEGALPVEVQVKLPEDFKLNDRGPVSYLLHADEDQKLVRPEALQGRRKAEIDGDRLRLEIPLAAATGTAELKLAISFTYCRTGAGGLCKLKTARWRIPVEVAAGAKREAVRLELTIE